MFLTHGIVYFLSSVKTLSRIWTGNILIESEMIEVWKVLGMKFQEC